MLPWRAIGASKTCVTVLSRTNRHHSRHSSHTRSSSNKKIYYIIGGGAAILLLGWAGKSSFSHAENVPPKKKKLVVLGSGWAAMDVVRGVDLNIYDVSVVSPRNYFLFTPLLASTAVGTVEFTSVVEPLRRFCKRAGATVRYFEAACTDVFYDKNIIRCEEVTGALSTLKTFDLEYDVLVIAVGASTSNMGIAGVQQNCLFLKDIHDARKIRQRIMACLESANYPTQTEAEKDRLLHFVIVGGGPTGVEFSAELHDFVMEDIPKYFPELAPKIKLSLIQSGEHILNTYDLRVSEYAEQQFKRENINLTTNARVMEVRPNEIVVFDKAKKSNVTIPCGMTVWATGVGPVPLTLKLAAAIPEQNNNKALVSDEFLRVKGIKNKNVYAVGDCLTIAQPKVVDKLVDLFKQADTNGDGALSIEELRALFKEVLPVYPQLEPFTRYLERHVTEYDTNKDGVLQQDEFKNFLIEVDRNLKTVPATAQAASQAGKYLAVALNERERNAESQIQPFRYKHLGSFAYVGGDSAVLDANSYKGGGFGVWWLWRATYFSKQLSWKNRFALAFDWVKAKLSGRDISKV